MFSRIVLLIAVTSLTGQSPIWPTSASYTLSSNFGEFRSTGYHMGLDIKTKGKEGFPVYAVEEGYISRMVANFNGFGKALYLTTTDGHIAVFAHLSRFSPKLETRLKKEQDSGKSYLVNHYFKKNEFPVKKETVIGFTGNTGNSFGPHLHFEYRNNQDQPLNPLKNGFSLEDRLSPQMDEISFVPLSPYAWLNGSQLSQVFPLFRDKTGVYHLPDTINVSGRIGIAVKAFDKRQGAKNIYQPSELSLWVDGKKYYSLNFDKLDYRLMPTANYVKNYKSARLNLGNFINLYRKETTPSIPIHSDELMGILDLTPGYHHIKINVIDAVGNTSVAQGVVFSMPPFELSGELMEISADSATFRFEPKTLAIPIKKIICYSFTPFGFADKKIEFFNSRFEDGYLFLTLPKKQIRRKVLQFFAVNKLGARSKPFHWINESIYGDHLSVDVDLEVRQTEAGVMLQVQAKKVIKEKVSLRLKGAVKYDVLSMDQIRPAVYLSEPVSPNRFEDVQIIEVLLSGDVKRQIVFDFPYTVAVPETITTALSQDKNCSIFIQPNTFTDTVLTWIEPVHTHASAVTGLLKSKVYQLQPFDTPLLQPLKVGIRYHAREKYDPTLHLYYYDSKEGWTFIPTTVNKTKRVLTGEVKHLDAIAILQDVTPPTFKSLHPGNGGRYPALEVDEIRVVVEDKLSGINSEENSIALELDGNPLRFAYQPRKKEVSFMLEQPLSPGKHFLHIRISDRAGNSTDKTISFDIY